MRGGMTMSFRMRAMGSLALVGAILAVSALCAGAGQVDPDPWQGYSFFFGNLHSHTSYSDGVLTPTDAFIVARDAADMDFLAVTDHGYYMQESTNLHHWYQALAEADAMYEPGRFVTLIGFEWTFTDGHMNGLDTPVAASRDTHRDMQAFIDFLIEHDGIGVFNHPNYDIQPNWNDFEYRGDADRQVALLEVGSGPYRHNITNERAYQRALNRGWHVGAASNQDNHRADWGTATPARTGVVAPELTRESILAALRAMRTYATEDRNVRAFLACQAQPMGSSVEAVRREDGGFVSLQFRVLVDDPDADDILASVEIVSNAGTVWRDEPNRPGVYDAAFELLPSSSYTWFYLRARQADGDLIVSSPVWATSGSGLAACDLEVVDRVPQAGRELKVRAEIVNRNDEPVRGCQASLFVADDAGRRRVATATLDLPAARGTEVLFSFVPEREGKCRLELQLEAEGFTGDAPDVFVGAAVEVRKAGLPKIIIDEGHNNRYSGYMNRFVALLADLGMEPVASRRAIDGEVLRGARVLVVNMPEEGFALTPTRFAEAEIDALADFVLGGGSILISGWSAADDGSRDPGDLNRLLEKLSAAMRFVENPEPGEEVSAAARHMGGVVEASWAGGAIRAEEARPLLVGEGPDVVAVACGTEVEQPFAALQETGQGRVAVLAAPTFSDYDLFRTGYSNAEFVAAIMEWLCGGGWPGR